MGWFSLLPRTFLFESNCFLNDEKNDENDDRVSKKRRKNEGKFVKIIQREKGDVG